MKTKCERPSVETAALDQRIIDNAVAQWRRASELACKL